MNPKPARDDWNYKEAHAKLIIKTEREIRSLHTAYSNNKSAIEWQVLSDLVYEFDSTKDGFRYRMSLTLSTLAFLVSLIALYVK
jgi:hypothetical protein